MGGGVAITGVIDFPLGFASGFCCVAVALVVVMVIALAKYSETIPAGVPGRSGWTHLVGTLSMAAPAVAGGLHMHLHAKYMYIYMHIYICIYIYTHIKI